MSAVKETIISGEKAQKVADALKSVNIKILKLTQTEPLYISSIAKKLGVSEAYISERVSTLEALGLVTIKYSRGQKGIRKIVTSDLDRIIINLKDEEVQ